jgi:hypothetical protein
MGIGLGLFVPALGPTLQRYSTLAHPKKATFRASVESLGWILPIKLVISWDFMGFNGDLMVI